MIVEVVRRGSRSCGDVSVFHYVTMFFQATLVESSTTANASKIRESSYTVGNHKIAPTWKGVPRCFQCRGKKSEAIDLILSPWRRSTWKQYGAYISHWLRYFRESKITVYKPSINNNVEFLTELHLKELGFSAINTANQLY